MADTLAILAAGFVLVSFSLPHRISLRAAAICANVIFIAYGLQLDLVPVWAPHAALLPINAAHLAAGLIRRGQPAGMRDSTISAHHDVPAGMALSSKSYSG